jgi:hypothetical protein
MTITSKIRTAGTKVMSAIFFGKCNYNNTGICTDDSNIFAIVRLFFHEVSVIFNTLFPTLSKKLCTIVVKFPASTSEHITKTLFQFVVICKMASTQCILYRGKQVAVRGCEIWVVSTTGKSSPSYVCNCLTCAPAGVRLGIVVKGKDVLHISVRMKSTDELLQFV